MRWLVRGGGRCAGWLSSVRSTTGEGDREAPPVAADADFDLTDFDHREFVSAGVAAGIAVRTLAAADSATAQQRRCPATPKATRTPCAIDLATVREGITLLCRSCWTYRRSCMITSV